MTKLENKAFEKHILKHALLEPGDGTYDSASASRDYNKNKSPDLFEAKKIKDKKTLREKAKIRQGRG